MDLTVTIDELVVEGLGRGEVEGLRLQVEEELGRLVAREGAAAPVPREIAALDAGELRSDEAGKGIARAVHGSLSG